jgi:hypothetical protein
MCAKFNVHLIIFNFEILITIWRRTHVEFAVTQLHLACCYNIPLIQIFYSVPLSQFRPICVPPLVRETAIPYTYKTMGRMTVLCILTFTFLDSRQKDKTLRTGLQQAFREFVIYILLLLLPPPPLKISEANPSPRV